jgi:SOS-response transcriptional repressor LexA
MPARILSISGQRQGTYVLLEAALPGRPVQPAGVILTDPATDRGWIRFREDFSDIAEPEDAEVLAAMGSHLEDLIAEGGAEKCLAFLEDTASNTIRISQRRAVDVDAFTRVVDVLYAEHVEPVVVEPYKVHLPLFSLRAAAGRLGEEMASEAEAWVRAPEGIRLTEDLFVAHVVGRSMEPRIPDGSLNLFRLHPVGSRQNKLLLIQRFGTLDETARYTVKKYTSKKIQTGEDQWEHERIRLEPLNPEFDAWDVEPQDFAVVAEWLRVID